MSNYIGYPTVEAMVPQLEKYGKVAVIAVTDPGKAGKYNISIVYNVVLVTHASDGLVQYCRIPIARYQSMDGVHPMGEREEAEKFNKWNTQAQQIVMDWLNERDFTVIEAMLSMPKTLRYLDGGAEFLGFDKEQGYYRKEVTELAIEGETK